MLLSKLTKLPLIGPDVDILGVTEDSRKVEPGFLFIATPGTKLDGRAFVADALQKGAVAVLLPEGSPVPDGVTAVMTADVRRETAKFAAAFYPRQPETVTAVTGTSGKTSTAQFVREVEQALGHTSASIGTLGLVTAEGTRYGSLTTPDAITLHRVLDTCAGQGITHAVMEASSHGIEMNRLDCIRLKAAGFTNLSRDHLDHYGAMEAYFAAKKLLFSRVLAEGSVAVLNADIPQFEALGDVSRVRKLRVLAYGKDGKELRLVDVRPDALGQVLVLDVFGVRQQVLLPVLGGFQAWNALCALGLVIGSGAEPKQAVAALEKVTGVPGRMQLIGTSREGGEVFVDYAHKPDALEKVLVAMRPHVEAHAGAKMGVVFGCGGDRDKGKRPIMGEISQKLADWSIVTDDNPRSEDPSVIRAEILAGYTDRSTVEEIGDRAKAIEVGIGKLKAHDLLIIAGKGHEPGQIVGDKVLPFDDAQEARRILAL